MKEALKSKSRRLDRYSTYHRLLLVFSLSLDSCVSNSFLPIFGVISKQIRIRRITAVVVYIEFNSQVRWDLNVTGRGIQLPLFCIKITIVWKHFQCPRQ